MRKVLIAFAALATIATVVSLAPHRAEAMTLPSPMALQGAVEDLRLAEEVYHRVCRRRCGPYGCYVRCWRAPHYGYYRPYRHYRYRYY